MQLLPVAHCAEEQRQKSHLHAQAANTGVGAADFDVETLQKVKTRNSTGIEPPSVYIDIDLFSKGLVSLFFLYLFTALLVFLLDANATHDIMYYCSRLVDQILSFLCHLLFFVSTSVRSP